MACKKPYDPQVIATNANYLVVEGLINTGNDSTIIKLSRTVNIAAGNSTMPELNAQVIVESDANGSFILKEYNRGEYASPALNLDITHKYRVRIKTADGKTYLSDFVAPKSSPPIDSVGYNIQSNGLQIYVNTHDPANNSRYYIWDYTETWVFQSTFQAYYKVVNGQPVYRDFTDPQIFQCWGNDTSSTIFLASSSKLSQDVIAQNPIIFVPATAEKLKFRYSIQLEQKVLTSDAYTYFQKLKKNTEQLGGIFDPQPSSELTGNIHNTSNAAEPVIGYISAGTVSRKRIFIDNRDLPAWQSITFYDTYGCRSDTITLKDVGLYIGFYGGDPPSYLPTTSANFAAPAICVDCTLRGTNKKPAFWK